MRSDMTYEDLKNQHDEIGAPAPCPSCFNLWQRGIMELRQHMLTLSQIKAMNPLSHRRGMGYICRRCGKMEFLMGYMGIDESMAYPPTLQDWAEAIRLPPGLMWGVTRYPTGGYEEWEAISGKLSILPFYAFEDEYIYSAGVNDER